MAVSSSLDDIGAGAAKLIDSAQTCSKEVQRGFDPITFSMFGGHLITSPLGKVVGLVNPLSEYIHSYNNSPKMSCTSTTSAGHLQAQYVCFRKKRRVRGE